MPLTNYLTLGRSGLRVSPLCLGAMTFGMDWGWGSTPEDSVKIIDAFLAKGGNFIDTANIYTKGHAETIIGEHLGKDPAKRDRVVIATKFMGNLFGATPNHPGDPNGGGAGRKGILGACEHSLRRLKTDYIDLYWMHFYDPHTPIEETMRTLDDLVRSGKVRYVGFSDTPAWVCSRAQTLAAWRGWSPLIALQIEYSLLERTVEGELIPMARELGMGVTPWSPLKGGVLSGKYTRDKQPPANRGAWVESHLKERAFKIIDGLLEIGKQVGATPAQVALSWVQNRPGVASTIIGARTMEQLEDNIKALDVHLRPEHLDTLEEASKPTLNFPAEFLQRSTSVAQSGTTINGVAAAPWPLAPTTDKERW